MTFVSDLRTRDRSRQHYANDALTGRQVRVSRGVYAAGTEWGSLGSADRYLATIHAVASTRSSIPIISHWSAAALHGLPLIGSSPSTVHFTVPPGSGARSRHRVTRHSMPLDVEDVAEISGLRVTSLLRTVVDIAALGKFSPAVVIADSALHEERTGHTPPLCTREQLLAHWENRIPFRGFARALEVIDFAVAHSDSALESVSRVNMELLGFPRPQLQVPFSDRLGFIGYADYFWPEFSLIGEADGDQKYLDPALRGAKTIEQVLLAQSKRENRLRALGHRVSRWDWVTAMSMPLLRSHLLAAGLPRREKVKAHDHAFREGNCSSLSRVGRGEPEQS